MKLAVLCLVATVATVSAQECNPEQTASVIVEQEAKFFQMGQDQGTRAAFLNFLADDSVVFGPGPSNGKKFWSARPEGGISLKWRPIFAAMSRSCDLGYTTGPSERRKNKEDEKPAAYGHFVSIWKVQKDGSWKVALDVGIEVPAAERTEETPEVSFSKGAVPPKTELAAIAKKWRQAEAWFATTAKTDSTAALIGSSSETVRVHREGVFPAVGRDPAALMLSVRRGALTVERIGGEMSKAADLAYSYGKYSLARSQETERGHYLQIWRTDDAGAWKLVLDYQSPLPPEQKQ